ncbi:MAG: GDP-mannose 4,6-dehydratase [Desulfobacteraceae bacterium]|nr:GDP-mannose 4,6-dehydratase [Desulfobacteraceae bacterium]
MANKSALIIGISGQDGAYLARLLLGKGYIVIGTSRDALVATFANLKRLGIRDQVKVESMSLNDFRSVLQTLKKYCPDEVYNLAGQSSVGLSFEQPVETFESVSVAALNLLEAIRFLGLKTRLYNAGSSECFGNTNGEPASETSPLHPRSPYAVAKAAAFWQVANYREAYNMYACSGILFNHESPLRPGRFVTQKIVQTACRIYRGSGEKLNLGNTSIQRDWGWAPEFVEAMWLMLQQNDPQDYVVASGKTFSLQDLVNETFSLLNLNPDRYVKHTPELLRPTEISTSVADTRKAESNLGWKAKYVMRDVIRMMVEAELNPAAPI